MIRRSPGVPRLSFSLLVLLIAHVAWAASAPGAGVSARTALARIDAAAEAGAVTHARRTVLRVTAVVRPEKLPDAFKSDATGFEKCATDVLVEAVRELGRQSPAVQAELAALLARPNTSDFYDSPGGHFRIHYSTSGTHAISLSDADMSGVPDYAENIARYADSSWNREVNTYGYLPPPSDGGLGGNSRYDIYCQSIPYYGYTQPETPGPAPWNDYASFIVVHNDFQGFPPNTDPDGNSAGAAKVTVAHEFMHACQFAYDVNESSWWMEATATWAEDEVFDVVNDNYNYLPGFYNTPQTSLYSTNGSHEYGAFVWPRFLSERFGPALIETIWQGCISGSILNVIDAELVAGYGSSRDDAFAEFTAWNWITGARDDGTHYEEGNKYALAPAMRTHSAYPVPPQTSSQVPGALACNYVSFQTGAIPAGRPLAVTFNGDDTQTWAAHLVGKSPGGTYDLIPLALDGGGQGSGVLSDASSYAFVALVPAAVGVTGTGNYSYSACIGPLPPDVVAPADGETTSIPATLEWEAVAGAESYRVQVAADSGFASPYLDSTFAGVVVEVGGLTEGAEYFWRVSMTDACATSAWGALRTFTASCAVSITGDVNVDGVLSAGDIVSMVNYIFKGGPAPQPIAQAADVNCSGSVTSGDVIYMVGHVFKGGPPPCDVCSIL